MGDLFHNITYPTDIKLGTLQVDRIYCGPELVWPRTTTTTTTIIPIIHFGLLYNWYSVTDSRGIVKLGSGFSVPTYSQAITLATYLEPYPFSNAGGMLKETGVTYWNSPNPSSNISKFNARGGGTRTSSTGIFGDLKNSGTYWTSNVDKSEFSFDYNTSSFYYNPASLPNRGNSVRLIKVPTSLLNGQTGTYTGTNGRIYNTICIGTQEWTSENLVETLYTNGDVISEITNNSAWTVLTTGAICAYNNDWNNV